MSSDDDLATYMLWPQKENMPNMDTTISDYM